MWDYLIPLTTGVEWLTAVLKPETVVCRTPYPDCFPTKLIYTVSTTFKNYASYFSPQFLFTSGAGEATYGMIPGRGSLVLYRNTFTHFLLASSYQKAWPPKLGFFYP